MEETKNYKIKDGTICYLGLGDGDLKGRVEFCLNKSFISIDKNGNECERDQFSLKPFALFKQLCRLNFEGKTEFIAFSNMGKNMSLEGLCMLLCGAKIQADRIFHIAGEEREYEEGVYDRDTYATKIVAIDNSSISERTLNNAISIIVKNAEKKPESEIRPII